MAQSDYRPGRRRKPTRVWLLDWAAGILMAIVLVLVGTGAATPFAGAGEERMSMLLVVGAVAWPLGSALGVWLCMGRLGGWGALGLGLVVSGLVVGVLGLPMLLELGPPWLAKLGVYLALFCAPLFARAMIRRLRTPEA